MYTQRLASGTSLSWQIEHRVLICSVSLDTEWGSNEIRKESKPASEATTEDVTKMKDDKCISHQGAAR